MNTETLIEQLNAPLLEQRLEALRNLKDLSVEIRYDTTGRDVNNHIHSTYSFSPYSPAKALWMAAESGLVTAGIMDHDSISGAREFIEAGEILGFATTIGAEVRASFAGTALEKCRINNPDQDGVAYVALHGIPHSRIDALTEFLKPVRCAREKRNRAMTERLNTLLAPAEVSLDYDRDVVSLSQWSEGGSVTERHLLFAVALKLLNRFGVGNKLVEFIRGILKIKLSEKAEAQLIDIKNPYVAYDLLGVLKSDLVDKFYIPATDECLPIDIISAFAEDNGIVLAYAYLGDVLDSVTGDKKPQLFEDVYLRELFPLLVEKGFKAVTYMPSRNLHSQLERVRELCDKYELFQISGEDINQPRQKFVCEAMRDPFFSNLYDAAWALIGHERAASEAIENGMFSKQTLEKMPSLDERIAYFAKLAKQA